MNRKKDASQLLPALALVVFGVWPLGCCDCAVAFANSPAAPPDRRVEGAFAVPACSGISSRVALLMVLALAKMRGVGLGR
jgi:hypothetical protein